MISRIESAASNALYTTMFDGLIDEIRNEAFERVYSYPNKSDYFAEKRRYTIADREHMYRSGSDLAMTVRNAAVTQGGEPGEVNWVEEGFHQDGAGARPFMEWGLEEYARNRASEDLAEALKSAGFDAHVG